MAERAKPAIGFVGVGAMGQCAHLRNYATLDECEVVAIAELRPDLRASVAARYGVPRTYETHQEMLKAEDLDGIVASQPFTRHGQLLPELLHHGRPVFCEKPIAASVAVGKRIAQAEHEGGSFLMVGYHKRSDPATMHAVERIAALQASGELGPLRYVRILMPAGEWIAGGFFDLVHAHDTLPQLESDPPDPEMDAKTYEAYVAFVNYYIHQVNLMRHLLGEDYHATHVTSSGVVMTVESENGISGVIEMSPYTTTVDWQEQALVCFERGYVRVDLPAPLAINRPGRVEVLRDPEGGPGPETITPTLPWVHAMRQQALNFVGAIRGDCRPLCTANEAVRDLEVAQDFVRLHKQAQK